MCNKVLVFYNLEHKPLEGPSVSVPPMTTFEKTALRNWHNKTFSGVSLWRGSDKRKRSTKKIINNSTIDSEFDNVESTQNNKDKSYNNNNNINNNNNQLTRVQATETDERLPKFST